MQGSRDEPYVLTLLRAVGRRWYLVLACALIAPAVAWAITLTQEEKYSASSSLLFRESYLSNTLFGQSVFAPALDPARAGQTNLELVALAAVSRRTAEALDEGLTAGDIQSRIGVDAGTDADLVDITATDEDAERAARIANAYASEFVEFRREADRRQVVEAQALIERQISALPTEVAGRGNALRRRAEELGVLAALQTGNAELVQEAVPPDAPSSPRPKRNIALGFVLGLILGCGLAIFLDRVDRRMRTPDDITDLLELPLLGAIPRSRSLRRGAASSAVEREGVAFQMLRTNLRYFNVDRQLESVMVTSAAAGDGKTTVAWFLAVIDAMAGHRVLLIEADLRNPALRHLVGTGPTRGLAEVLVHELDFEEAVQTVSVRESGDSDSPDHTVDVLFAGWTPPNPAQLIESDGMQSLLRKAEKEYDLVIVDTPPLPVVSDAIPLVNQVSGVVVVARLLKNTRNALETLRGQLVNLGAPTLGVVINDVASRGDADAYGYGMDPETAREERDRSERIAAQTQADQTS